MSLSGLWRYFFAGILLGWNWFVLPACGGGSGLNTLVVLNQNSGDSMALANYYCERRQVPPENVLRIDWSGGNTSWNADQFQSVLLQPLRQAIASRGLSNQIHYVVLSMDIPFATQSDAGLNGTTSVLFYGLKSNAWPGTVLMTNSYYASEAPFPEAHPAAAPGFSFLTTMITAADLAQAKRLVDQGVNSDATFPNAPVVLANTTDPARRLRSAVFDNAIFNTRLRGDYWVLRTNSNSPLGLSGLLGYQTGLPHFSISPDTFVPGAMADSMTSFGGIIFGPNSQTSLLAFIGAGAAGSYGTVTEPTANLAKFPSPQNYFYQARGFTLAESYYQSLAMPYQGLIVGEPLAAPFAQPGIGGWLNLASNAVLSGTTPLTVRFAAADDTRALQRVDLFVDGKFAQTLTNLAPSAGNLVRLRVNGQSLSYPVPANATLDSVATGIATLLNTTSNLTRTVAQAFGDRVELRYFGTNRPVPPGVFRISAGTATAAVPEGAAFQAEIGTAAAQTIFAHANQTFLDTAARGRRTVSVTGTVQAGVWLRLIVTKTNGTTVAVTYTNQVAGATAAEVLTALFERINESPALQGADGVEAEDLTITGSSQYFYLLPRSAGLKAAEIMAQVTSSTSSLIGSPASARALNSNLTDLQSRNHLYLSTGADELTVTFPFNTTTFADGFHELTAVAYEGNHVRTQTRVSIPVRIQNTSLTATLQSNIDATNSVSGDYAVQVNAAGNINSITLYSTGGALETVANQASATFAINGTTLGAGVHPLYALVQDTQGRRFRTDKQVVRLISP